MQTKILINGKLMAITEKTYEGKKTVYAQFLMESEAKGMEIIKVKITQEADIIQLKKDEFVSVPIVIACVNNTIYFTQCDAMKKNEIRK
ncbi:hypothetical protein FA592_13405 [Sulfurospirillum diekertiae]|uniref:Uncharacterized protein n=1 Tax=Sulfurospirillum diekertiae TaxID=1854492 RepID=A0A6G9VWW6_9BACT|nr:hypothetical protein [Sulfurospirillum diekertiae]QIR77176.1 hypothetical protein FA584_13610 [Sulfurospirillum diekertiae]QIR79790.1 hypothetical protein FA592_13405 [Sulfurospirillum diekertiae]